MSRVFRYPLEFAEIDGLVKHDLWSLISRLAESQREHHSFFGQIEDDLGWVDITTVQCESDRGLPETRWLRQTMTTLESYKPANVSRVKTYVVRFNGSLPGEVVYYDGIPEDVYFVQVYGAQPYPMNSLRDEHLRIQFFYSVEIAKPPPTRIEELRLIQERNDASTSYPLQEDDVIILTSKKAI